MMMRQKREKMDYVEVWSGHPEGGRVVEAVKEQGGAAMGIGMGTGYNLQDKDTAGEVRYRLDAYWRPRTLMLCPPCTAWGSWNRFNMAKGSFRAIKNKPKARAEARLRARGYPLAQGRQEGPKGQGRRQGAKDHRASQTALKTKKGEMDHDRSCQHWH